MKLKCVVIEDEIHQNELLQFIAKSAGFNVSYFLNAEDFIEQNMLDESCYIIDWNLPGKSGLDVVRMIREKNKIAKIFIVTANYQLSEIQMGLDSGADDYIWKPYHAGHLISKLANAHTKYQNLLKLNVDSEISFFDEVQLLIAWGKKISLTKKEFEIAKILYSSNGSCSSREHLSAKLLLNSDGNALDVHMHALRNKISDTNIKIKNMRGVGFIWI